MELKVWCDGIQRVVCGVNSGTTCQDVVFALAHATAQTGRFILIEKWHNSERLLAPSEHPLKVLSKWGEYANDVTFVMKRSETHSKTNANLSLSPQSSAISSSSATSPQHMLATAGGGVFSSPNRRDFFHLFNNNNIYSSVNKKSGVFQQNGGSSSPSMAKQMASNPTNPNNSSNSTPNASPLKSNSCLNSSHNNTNSNSNNNKTAVDSNNDLMANRQQMNNKNNNLIELGPTKGTAIAGNRPRHPPPYSEAISKSTLVSGAGQPNNSCSSHLMPLTDTTCSTNKRRSGEPSPQSQKQKTAGSQKELLLHRDALRLVDMQKETLLSQEKEMSSLEQQIGSIEKRLVKNELLINRYKDEMEACHQLWLDQEVMIDQLGDQHLLEQDLDQLADSSGIYEEEMMALKHKLSTCETDIGDCRQHITKLMDQLEDDQRLIRDKALDKEDNHKYSAEQLKFALRDQNLEFEAQKNELQTITTSIKQLDSVLSDKSSQVDQLLSDIKEANIQGLALQTADEKQRFKSNSNGQTFHQRSGSTRRMIGSPRQLENAVATNKNPHGVWV